MPNKLPLINTVSGQDILRAHTPRQQFSVSGISRLGNHDDYLRPEINQEANRGYNQSTLAKWGNGLTSRALSIIPKVGQGLGHVGGALVYLGDLVTPGEANPDVIWSNAVTEAFANMDQSLRESFPVHKQRQYLEGNVLAKMGTPEFWAEDFADGLAFLASAYVPSVGITKLGNLAKGTKLANRLKKYGDIINRGTTTAYNTISEAGFEAKETYDSLVEEYQTKVNPDTGSNYTLSEAKTLAGEAASRIFRGNMVALLAPNYLQSTWFKKGKNGAANSIRQQVRSGQAAEAVKTSVELMKAAGVGIFSEGFWEENIQTAMSQYESHFASGATDKGFFEGVAYNWVANAKGALKAFSPFHEAPKAHTDEDEGATAIVLGGLIGLGGNVTSKRKELAKEQEQRTNETNTWNAMKALHNPFKTMYVDNAVAGLNPVSTEQVLDEEGNPTGETKNLYVDKNNKTSPDKDNMTKMFMRLGKEKSFSEIAGAAAIANNKYLFEANNAKALAAYAWHIKSIPGLEQEDINDLLTYDLGLEDSRVENQDLLRNNRDTIESMLKLYDDVKNDISGVEDFSDIESDKSFNAVLTRTLYGLEVNKKVLDNLSKLNDNETFTEQIEGLKENIDSQINSIKKNRAKIKKEFNQSINRRLELEKKKSELATKLAEGTDTAKTQEEIDILDYKIKELDHTKGYFNDQSTGLNEYYTDYFTPTTENRLSANRPLSLRENALSANAYQRLLEEEVKQDISEDRNSLEIIEKLIKHSKAESPNKESFAKILNERVDANILASNETLTNLNSVLTDTTTAILDIQDGIEPDLTNELVNYATSKGFIGSDVIIDNLQLINDTVQQEINEADSTLKENQFAKNRLKDYQSLTFEPVDLDNLEEELPAMFFDQETAKYRRTIQDFKKDKEDYINSAISSYLSRLEDIKRYTESRDDISDRTKSKILKKIEKLIEQLLEAKKVSDSNNASRRADQLITEQFRNESIQQGLNSLQVEDIPDTTEELLVKLQSLRGKIDLNKITSRIASISTSLHDIIRSLQSVKDLSAGTLSLRKDGTSEYTKNPDETIFKVIKSLFREQFKKPITRNEDGTMSPLDKFRVNQDFNLFRLALEKSDFKGIEPSLKEGLIKIIELHSEATGLNIIFNELNSTYSLSDLIIKEHENLSKEISKKAGKKIFPSKQQIQATRDIIAFLSNPKSNSILLKGIFGSGKTKVVVRRALDIAESMGLISKTDIIATGHNSKSSSIIASSINVTKRDTEQLIQNDFNNAKYLIIDEVFAYTNREYNQIIKNAKENGVKVIALGDPSQVTVERVPQATKIKHRTANLTAVLRTNVSNVADIARTYQYNPFNVSATGELNKPIEEFDRHTLGVYSGGTSRDKTQLKELVNKTNRSKMIIVNHVDDLIRYSDVPENVTVTTYDQAQGNEAEEVYIDMSFSGKNLKGEPFADINEFNTAMATSISRGGSFVYINGNTGIDIKNSVDPGISENTDQLIQELEDNKSEYLESLDNFKQLLDKSGKKIKFTKPTEEKEQAKEEENTPIIKQDDVQSKDPEPDEVTPDTPTPPPTNPVVPVEGEHTLSHPTNIHIYDKDSYNKDESVKKGQNMIIVKANIIGQGEKWIVFSQVGDDKYLAAGVIGRDDTSQDTLKHLPDQAKNVSPIRLNTINDVKSFKQLEKGVFATGRINSAQRFKIGYLESTPKAFGLNYLKTLFNQTFFNPQQREEKKPNPKLTITGFTKRRIADDPDLQNIKVGMPYLIIEDPTGNKGRDIYIRLNPPRFSKNSQYYQPIKQLRDAIETVSKAINVDPNEFFNTKDFSQMLDEFTLLYEPSIENKEFSYKPRENADFNEFKRIYGLDGVGLEALETIMALTRSPQKRARTFTKEEFDQLHQMDPNQYPQSAFKPFKNDASKGTVYKVINNEDVLETEFRLVRNTAGSSMGQAIRAWNRIGKTNGVIDGKNIRVERTLKDGETFIAPKSLIEYRDSKNKFAQLLRNQLGSLRKSLRQYLKDNPGLDPKTKRNIDTAIDEIGKVLGGYGEVDGELIPVEDNFDTMHKLTSIYSSSPIGTQFGLLNPTELANEAERLIAEPVSFKQLDYLVGDASFDSDGNHIGTEASDMYMLEPVVFTQSGNPKYPTSLSIGKKTVTPENYEEFGFTTRFTGVTRTSITVELDAPLPSQPSVPVSEEYDSKDMQIIIKAFPHLKESDIQNMDIDKFEDLLENAKYLLDGSFYSQATTVFPDTVKGKEISITEARMLLKKILPGYLKDSSVVEFLRNIHQAQKSKFTDIWGNVSNGILRLRTTDNGTVFDQVLRHEVLHYIYKYAINNKYRKLLNESMRRNLDKLGFDTSNLSIEEALAETYQRSEVLESYRKSLPFRIKKFINDIFNFFGLVYDHKVQLDTFFYNIDAGYYSNRPVDFSNPSSSNLAFITENFGSIEAYKQAKNILVDQILRYQEKGVRLPNSKERIVVTKEEAVRRIRLFIENNVEQMSQDLSPSQRKMDLLATYQKLLENNPFTKRPLYFDMIGTIYPNLVLEDTNEDFLFDYSQDPDSIDQGAIVAEVDKIFSDGLRKEIQDTAAQNPEKGQSDALKNFLAFIKHPNIKNKFLNSRFAFIRTARLFDNIDLNNLSTLSKQITQLKKSNEDNLTSSIVNKLDGVILQAQAHPKLGETSTNFTIVAEQKDVTGGINYHLVVDPTGELDMTNLSYEEARDNDNLIFFSQRVIIKDGNGMTVKTPLGRLYIEASNQFDIEVDDFNNIYKTIEARNTLRDMQNIFGSMKETEYRILNKKKEFNSVKINYPAARSSSSRLSTLNELKDAFRTKLDNDELKNFTINKIIKLSKDKPTTALKLLLSKDNLNIPHLSIHLSSAVPIKEEIINLLKSIKSIPKEGSIIYENGFKVFDVDETGKEIPRREDPIEEWAEKQSGRLSKISNFLSKNLESNRATSIVGGGGKKIYTRHIASFANKMLRIVSDQRRNLPEYLQTDYYKDNIFVNKLNKIHSVIDHESFRNILPSGEQITDWLLQSQQQFYTQIFSGSFLQGPKNRYFQLIYQQEDKPRPVGVEVNILSPSKFLGEGKKSSSEINEIKVGLRNMIIQHVNQIDLSSRIKKYKKHTDNLQLMVQASENLGLDITEDNVVAIVDEMYDLLTRHSIDVAKKMVELGVDIPTFKTSQFDAITNINAKDSSYLSDLSRIYQEVEGKEYVQSPFKTNKRKKIINTEGKGKNRKYVITMEQLLPYVDLWTKNHYINSYFASQLVFDSDSFYQGSSNQIKRAAGPFAPGHVPLVNTELGGMKDKFTMAVVGDTEVSYESIQDLLSQIKFKKPYSELSKEELDTLSKLEKLFPKGAFEKTDAQAFMLPERFQELRKGFGRGFKLSTVMKPVYFGPRIEEIPIMDSNGQPTGEYNRVSVPTYLKYSTVVLTDALVEQFPELNIIRNRMRSGSNGKPISELFFGSAFKVGQPKGTIPLDSFLGGAEIPAHTVLDLDNRNYRMQLNPRSKPDKKVSTPTQLMYFINILNKNPKEARKIYGAMSYLIEDGLEDFNNSTENIRSFLKKRFNKSGDEVFFDILNQGISHQNPIIEKKAIIQLASLLEKLTVDIKFNGGKTNLQSAIGSDTVVDPNTGKTLRSKPLEYFVKEYENEEGETVKELYAEIIVPKGLLTPEQEALVRAGKEIFVNGDLLGFRIPSTELHSALSLKVVGIYDDKGTNVTIVPQLVMAISGHDHDGDSLFIIRRPTFNTTIQFANLDELGDLQFYDAYEKGEVIGHKKVKGKLEFDPSFEKIIINEIINHNSLLESNTLTKEETKLVKANLKKLKKVRRDFYKSMIVNEMLNLVSSEQNHNRVLAPINLGIWEPIIDEIDKRSPKEKKPIDLSSPLGSWDALKSVADGSILIGVDANAIKDVAYMIKSGTLTKGAKVKEIVDLSRTIDSRMLQDDLEDVDKLRDDIDKHDRLKDQIFEQSGNEPFLSGDFRDNPIKFNVDGKDISFDKINQEEAGSGDNVWNTLASMVNVAIDNVKEQILPKINATINTGPAYMALLSLGFPKESAVYLMTQPIVTDLLEGEGKLRVTEIVGKINTKTKELIEANQIDIEGEEYTNKVLSNKDLLDGYNSEDVVNQLKTLEIFKTSIQLGEGLTKLSRFLNIVRTLPVTVDGIENVLTNFTEIFDINLEQLNYTINHDMTVEEYITALEQKQIIADSKTFPFDIPLFFHANPHITSALRTVLTLQKKIEENFGIHSAVFKKFMEDLNLPTISINGDQSKATLRREVVRYLIPRIFKNEILRAETTIRTANGKNIEIKGSKAWSQKWINKLRAVKDFDNSLINEQYEGNKFLKNLFVRQSGPYASLSFSNATSLIPEDIIEFKESFNLLGQYEVVETDKGYEITKRDYNDGYTQFQKEFVTYAAINFGFSYGNSNYAAVLPVEVYNEFNNRLTDLIKEYTDDSSDLRMKSKEHLLVNLLIENAKGLRSFVSSDQTLTGTSSNRKGEVLIDDKKVYYDIAYFNNETSEADFNETFPEYISRSGKAYRRLTNHEHEKAAYQQLGSSDDFGYDSFEQESEYRINEAFDPHIFTVTNLSNKDNVISSPLDLSSFIESGETIKVISKFDRSRQFPRYVKITEVGKKRGDFTEYSVEDVENLNQVYDHTDIDSDTDVYQIFIKDESIIMTVKDGFVTNATGSFQKYEGKKLGFINMVIRSKKGSITLLAKDCN